jgi:DNA-binding NtrC family response regulator
LRLLQDREFHRVGGTHQIRADIRFLAATNKDLPRAVKEGAFREDLYYRLSMFPVALPPLRDRQEDTSVLAGHIIVREGQRANVKKKQLSPGAMEALCHYHWPGNIRELENVLARAVILSDGSVIHAEELGLPGIVAPQGAPPIPEGTSLPYHDSMEAHSRWLITQALRRTGWNQTQAAVILKLQRTYLTKLMKQKKIPSRPSES